MTESDMMDAPEIVDMADFDVAFIAVEVEAARIREIMGPTLAELRGAVAAQGLVADGPWLTHHWRRPDEKFVFDLCLPTPRQIAATGRVRPGLVSAPRIARCQYIGDYSGLPGAWTAFSRWIAAQGVKTRADFWETYLCGPGSGLPPRDWRTELVKPLE
jgi:effector-binding domain-containing protein